MIAILLLACGGDTEPEAPAPPSSIEQVPPAQPEAPTTVEPLRFTLRNAKDILELYEAVDPYAQEGRPAPPLVIELPPGAQTEAFELQLGDSSDAHPLDITLVGKGTTLGAGSVALVGRRVTVKDVAFVGPWPVGRTVELVARDAVTLDGVAVTGMPAPEPRTGVRLRRGVAVRALGPGTTLTVRDSLFLDNRGAVEVGALTSGAAFATARFERVRFGGNAAPELALGAVDRVEFVESVRLGGDGALVQPPPRVPVASSPTEQPADAATLAAWRSEVGATAR